jgi:nicotinamide-nucleotide amidase
VRGGPAELIAVGSELLRFRRADTNTLWLSDRLEALGVEVLARILVEDDPHRIASHLGASAARARLVILTGGLGPTEDDRTREAMALAFGLPLERDQTMEDRLRERLRRLGRPYTEGQARQADRPRGSEWIANPLGSAPGILLQAGEATVAALPGVPAEMMAMFEQSLAAPWGSPGRVSSARRVLRVAGRTESEVDEAVRELYHEEGVVVTILAGGSGVELLLRAEASSAELARDRLDRIDAAMAQRLGADLLGRDGDSLPAIVGQALEEAGLTLATAESCTAGLLAGAVTEVPGSSRWFRGGLVTYDDALKVRLAGVPQELLAAWGAVSEPVARALAAGARSRCGADVGMGVTGIAGPGGATADKPVGLVWVAVEDASGAEARRLLFSGGRDLVRRRAVTASLDLLRRRLMGHEKGG